MPAQPRPYLEVDVFSEQAYRGNPLAVVADGAGLDSDQMQQFARWTNLSETCFLLPPSDARADYRVRIFTPHRELPFAGHPTLGSCHTWLHFGGTARHRLGPVQECGLGLVQLRTDGTRLAFAAPAMQRAAVEPVRLAALLNALGLRPENLRASQHLDNGPQWLGLLVDSAATVLALDPDHRALSTLGLAGVIGPAESAPERQTFEVRAFASADGINEDPVTGSLNAALAQWLIADGLAPERYLVHQGSRLHRAGRVHLSAANGQIWVGGNCHTCVTGSAMI